MECAGHTVGFSWFCLIQKNALHSSLLGLSLEDTMLSYELMK